MAHLLAVSHVVSAVVALVLMPLAMSLVNTLKGGKKRHTPAHVDSRRRRGTKRVVTSLHHLLVAGIWALTTPAGWLVANKRYALVEAVLRPFEEDAQARGHRIGHALCVPLLLRPQWVVHCRGCGAWAHLREVPSLRPDGVDLKLVRGALYGAGRCPARYLAISLARPVRPRRIR